MCILETPWILWSYLVGYIEHCRIINICGYWIESHVLSYIHIGFEVYRPFGVDGGQTALPEECCSIVKFRSCYRIGIKYINKTLWREFCGFYEILQYQVFNTNFEILRFSWDFSYCIISSSKYLNVEIASQHPASPRLGTQARSLLREELTKALL